MRPSISQRVSGDRNPESLEVCGEGNPVLTGVFALANDITVFLREFLRRLDGEFELHSVIVKESRAFGLHGHVAGDDSSDLDCYRL